MEKKDVKTYEDLVKFLNIDMVLCNKIIEIDPDMGINTEEEIYQYYIIDENSGEYLEKNSNEIIAYSELLDVYVWCIDHCGTSWDYVPFKFKSK